MRVVLDTNTIISGLFWDGLPGRVYDGAIDERYTLLASKALLNELLDVLQRPKFAPALKATSRTSETIMMRHRQIATIVEPVEIPSDVIRDPDDRDVLGCAVGGHADYIVSGDKDLLTLQLYDGITIVSAGTFLSILEQADT